MIEPNIDMLYRFLFVYLIIHIVAFVFDVIRKKTTYKIMNKKYYWEVESFISTLLSVDLFLIAFVVAIYAIIYILG